MYRYFQFYKIDIIWHVNYEVKKTVVDLKYGSTNTEKFVDVKYILPWYKVSIGGICNKLRRWHLIITR